MKEDPDKITYFAKTNSRGKETPFGIKRRDRGRHLYVIGKTGMGKSTLLENMAIQDIRNGEGMAFIDPHGSTADRIMEYVPEHRIKDLVYFAPFDMDHPVAFNIMEDVGYDKRHLVVSGLLSAFRKIWVDAWSARMEYILSNTLLALLEYPGATLLDVNRMLINKAFRKKVVENVQDPIVKSFWVDEFANYTDRYTQDATPAIQNKVGQFTSNPLIRNIVGQPKSSFDIRQIMDEKKIIIMNLSKGRVGEVNANLLGSMLVTKIYLAAMSRADTSAAALAELPNFYFYVDEFQSFANQSFADILSEARKYKLNLIIAHQYVEQMEEEVRDAVFGNVGTTISFRVGPFDAETLETIFLPQFSKEDLVNLGFAQIYLTLMIDGVGSPPFSATTLPPFDAPPQKYVAQVIEHSREQFGRLRSAVEEAIEKWQGAEGPALSGDRPSKRAPRPVAGAPVSAASDDAPRPISRPVVPAAAAVSHGPTRIESVLRAPRESHASPQPPPASSPARAPAPPQEDERGRAFPEHPKPTAEPAKPRTEAARPPLSGIASLREAIEKATGEKVSKQQSQTKSGNTPSLKDTLQKIVAPNRAPSVGAPLSDKTDLPKPPPVSSREPSHTKQPRGMPEGELRDMLRVHEIDGDEK